MTTEEKKVSAIHNVMDVMLHPLVVISISDHFTRTRVNAPTNSKISIVGILLGMINGGKIEITNSFDIVATFDPASGKLTGVDESFLRKRTEAFTTVFPNTTVVGWYESGSTVDPDDALVMARILAPKAETLFTMTFDRDAAYNPDTKDIPMELFEAELKGDSPSEQTVALKHTPYHVITIEAERIGVDHIAKSSTTEGASQLNVHVSGIQGAMKMLNSRIDTIIEYLKQVQSGGEYDPDIMRKIGVLHDILLVSQTSDFDQRFFVEYNDEMLLAYLSSLTEGLQTMNTMADTHMIHRQPREPAMPKAEKHGSRKQKYYGM